MIARFRRLLVIGPYAGSVPRISPDQVSRWRDLADRRRLHFIEPYGSGRWKHYCSEADFVVRMREVCQAAEKWEKLASAPTGASTG